MHTVLIATRKAGAGKSTLAAHLGALADRHGRAACGIDATRTSDFRLALTSTRQS